MKQFISVFAFLAFSLVLFAQDKMANNIDNSNIALQGYSSVSYLDLGIAQRGSKEFKSEYKKILYYFTSAEQKATFDNNPEKYLPHSEWNWLQTARVNICTIQFVVPPLRLKRTTRKGKQR